MTDKAAPKAKKSKKDEETKVPGPKVVTIKPAAGAGHNSGDDKNTGEQNPEAIKCLDELMAIEAQKKALAKASRDVRNRLKSEFHILASSVSRELSLRKLDADVRVQVESNHEDFKKMLGYQPSLDFSGAKPTDASLKAQPSEAELAERNTEPTRGKTHKPDEKGFHVESAEDDKQEAGVIVREG